MNKLIIVAVVVLSILGISGTIFLYYINQNSIFTASQESYALEFPSRAYDREVFPNLEISTCGNTLVDTQIYSVLWTSFFSDSLDENTYTLALSKLRRPHIMSWEWKAEYIGSATMIGYSKSEITSSQIDCKELQSTDQKGEVKWTFRNPLSEDQKELNIQLEEIRNSRTLNDYYALELNWIVSFVQEDLSLVQSYFGYETTEELDAYLRGLQEETIENGPSQEIIDIYQDIVGLSLIDSVNERLMENGDWKEEYNIQLEKIQENLLSN